MSSPAPTTAKQCVSQNYVFPDVFFGKVRTHLEQGNLDKALKVLQSGNSRIHRRLVVDNIKGFVPYLRESAKRVEETAQFRCNRLTKIMQKHFPDVFQLEQVRQLGIQSGLTEQEVNEALEEVCLEDGRFWVIKTVHNDKFKKWENALRGLGANNIINFHIEGHLRQASYETWYCRDLSRCSLERGLFRGLENVQSFHWNRMILFYCSLFNNAQLLLAHITKEKGIRTIFRLETHLLNYLIEIKHNPISFEAIVKTAEKENNPIAKSLCSCVSGIDLSIPPAQQISKARELARKMLFEFNDLKDWKKFFEVHLPVCFADGTEEVQVALQTLLTTGKKYKDHLPERTSSTEDSFEALFKEDLSLAKMHEKVLVESGWDAQMDRFVDIFRKPRDIIFADSFYSEWPNRKKEVLTVAMFGKNHVPGFKEQVFLRDEGKADGKTSDNGDAKSS